MTFRLLSEAFVRDSWRSVLQDMWQDLCGWNWKKFGVRLQEHRTEHEAKTTRTFTRSQKCIQLIRTQQIRPHRPSGSREPYDQLVQSYGDRQRAGVIFQVDQRGSIHICYQSGRGQLSTQSRLRPLSWHGIFQSCKEPEELSTSFFWWRPLIEAETWF